MRRKICRAALVSAFMAVGIAQASEVKEIEPNHPIGFAQHVEILDGSLTISAVLGTVTWPLLENDLDFYAFLGREGDVITVDIDGGIGGARSVDTIVAIFSTAPGYPILRMNDDRPAMNDTAPSLDDGSSSRLDARLDNVRLPATAYYIVGVSNSPRYFLDGGTVINPTTGYRNGDYKLVISGVSPPLMQINIEIKPGTRELAPINPKSKGKIPVALLSSHDFDAMKVNTASLTFGATGNERSFSHCGKDGEDVDADGRLDLVCHFENQAAGFQRGDLEGILRGQTLDGRRFEGRGLLKVVPEKRGS